MNVYNLSCMQDKKGERIFCGDEKNIWRIEGAVVGINLKTKSTYQC